jgi:hypothetical protein
MATATALLTCPHWLKAGALFKFSTIDYLNKNQSNQIKIKSKQSEISYQ